MTRLILIALFAVASLSMARAQEAATSFSPDDPAIGPTVQLWLEARLTKEGDKIGEGMTWRVFGTREDETGKLPLVATAQGGSAAFDLPSGSYLVHAAFGRAGATKRVSINGEDKIEDFVLEAGGLRLNAETDAGPINPRLLRFSIYEREQDAEGRRKLIALNVEGNTIVRLNSGTYHVLSRYGTINATVRADLEVKAGKVTEAVLQHRGAPIALRLVSEEGGAPIANTAWRVFTGDGQEIFKSSSIAPGLVLAEGTYEAVVRYGNDTLRQSFKVESGAPVDVQILLTDG